MDVCNLQAKKFLILQEGSLFKTYMMHTIENVVRALSATPKVHCLACEKEITIVRQGIQRKRDHVSLKIKKIARSDNITKMCTRHPLPGGYICCSRLSAQIFISDISCAAVFTRRGNAPVIHWREEPLFMF